MKGIIKPLIAICLAHIVLLTTCAYGQEKSFPEIRKMMPAFAIKTDEKNKEDQISSESLKGKHYILDFWTTGCLACIQSFPKIDSLQAKYLDKLKILLIGREEKNRDVGDFFNFYKKKGNLKISSAFDSTTFEKFVHAGVPFVVWVDNFGMVKAVTSSGEVNEKNIQKFLENQEFSFTDMSYATVQKARVSFDKNKPLLINGNGGSDTSYIRRTIFSLWVPGTAMPYFPAVYPRMVSGRCQYQVIGAPIDVLFILGFFGANQNFKDAYIDPQFSEDALIKIRQKFGSDRRFNYSLELPADMADISSMMFNMQNDLTSFFDLNAKVVEKPMPCYKFVITDISKFSKIKATTGKKNVSWRAEQKLQTFTNIPVNDVLGFLTSKVLESKRVVTFNDTGTNANISFEIEADVNNIESIRNGLHRVGLDLQPSTNQMRVIEITARK